MRQIFARLPVFLCFVLGLGPAVADDSRPHIDVSGANMQPAYPQSAKTNNERGAVVLDVEVNPDGKVNSIRLHQTSGFNDLDSAAIAAVMDWHFIPAMAQGKPVTGSTSVQLVFQPPADNGKTETPAPIKPPSELFEPVITINAPRGEYNQVVRDIPCPNGKIITTVEFQKTNGPAASEYRPLASVRVQSGDQEVHLQMVGLEYIAPPLERFWMLRANESDSNPDRYVLNFSHVATFGRPVGVSLAWNSQNRITANVGAMEEHDMRMQAAPKFVGLSMAAGSAQFENTALLCFPDSPH